MRNVVLSVVALATVLLVGVGCEGEGGTWKMPWEEQASSSGGGGGGTVAPAKSLYERLGGKPAITAVVNDFVAKTAGNPAVNFTRKGIPGAEWDATPSNVDHLKVQLVDFLTLAFGGPNNYKGKSMKDSHAKMKITQAEFNALAGDLAWALDKNKVPADLKAEVMKIAASTAPDIVTVK